MLPKSQLSKKQELAGLHRFINTQLSESKDKLLSSFLVELPEVTQAELIAGFARHDIAVIERILAPIMQTLLTKANAKKTVKELIELLNSPAKDALLNETAMLLLQHLLQKPFDDPTQSLDYKVRILKQALESIPDKELSVVDKVKLCKVLDLDSARRIGMHVSYAEPVKVLKKGDIFLITSDEKKAPEIQNSDTNHLRLYAQEGQLFYYFNGKKREIGTHDLQNEDRQVILSLFNSGEKYRNGLFTNGELKENQLRACNKLLEITSERGHARRSENRFSGNLNSMQYMTALKSVKIDFSEFILLSVGFLQSFCKEKSILNDIRQSYLMSHYEDAIEKIVVLVERYKENIDPKIISLLKNEIQLQEVDINTNFNRRFFENRLSQIFLGQENTLQVAGKISQHLLGTKVEKVDEIVAAIINISESSDRRLFERYKELQRNSKLISTRDRKKISEKLADTEESDTKSYNTDTYNPGILKSITPNYRDELTSHQMTGRLADVSRVNEVVPGYSANNPRTAFVASVSGHSIFVAVMLEKYYQENKDDPAVIQDINEFIKAYALASIHKGYHSYLEIIDVFKDPQIGALFTKNGECFLNFNFDPATLEAAFRDTQEYTKVLSIKETVHQQLSAHNRFFSAPKTPAAEPHPSAVVVSEFKKLPKA